jgi:hypothetical protein
MRMSVPPRVSCRRIEDADRASVVDLLARGFPARGRAYWQRALDRLAAHVGPPNLPKFGLVLECGGAPVGVILMISSFRPGGDGPAVCCNLSSWYVEPAFRTFAPLLISNALAHKNVTFVNVSPAPHTRPIVEAQGFSRYSDGQFAAVAALAAPPDIPGVRLLDGGQVPDAAFDPFELELVRTHASYGCITLWCETPDRAMPFVFLPRLVNGVLPCAELIHCPDLAAFVRFARPIGRFLFKRARAFVIIDAPGPIKGLPGFFFPGKRPKYYRGIAPCPGDLAYTEIPMFGL